MWKMTVMILVFFGIFFVSPISAQFFDYNWESSQVEIVEDLEWMGFTVTERINSDGEMLVICHDFWISELAQRAELIFVFKDDQLCIMRIKLLRIWVSWPSEEEERLYEEIVSKIHSYLTEHYQLQEKCVFFEYDLPGPLTWIVSYYTLEEKIFFLSIPTNEEDPFCEEHALIINLSKIQKKMGSK